MQHPFFHEKNISEIIAGISRVAQYLWDKGWAERNAGNISVNITPFFSAGDEYFPVHSFKSLELAGGSIKNQIFMVTAAGSRMRDLARQPEDHLCIIRINEIGSGFHQFYHDSAIIQPQPTSEIVTHLAVHEMLINSGSVKKAILHTHATELIALSHIPQYCSTEAMNELLWKMHPETLLFVPDGLGFIPFALHGMAEIAQMTAEILKDHPAVLWEKHGIIATGTNIVDAFDIIDILAKSARIYFTCHNAGIEPEGLSREQISRLNRSYNL